MDLLRVDTTEINHVRSSLSILLGLVPRQSDNLPQGRFERRVVAAIDAEAMIQAARASDTLLCVSKDDLLAPYRARERRRHEELCAVLRANYHWSLGFEDFLSAFDGDGSNVVSITPLQLAELNQDDSLLIVTKVACAFMMARLLVDPAWIGPNRRRAIHSRSELQAMPRTRILPDRDGPLLRERRRPRR